MASRYKAAKGAQYSHADAQIIGEYLENIGEFTPVFHQKDQKRPPCLA